MPVVDVDPDELRDLTGHARKTTTNSNRTCSTSASNSRAGPKTARSNWSSVPTDSTASPSKASPDRFATSTATHAVSTCRRRTIPTSRCGRGRAGRTAVRHRCYRPRSGYGRGRAGVTYPAAGEAPRDDGAQAGERRDRGPRPHHLNVDSVTDETGTYSYNSADPDEATFVPLDADAEMTPSEVMASHETGQTYGDLVADFERVPAIYDAIGLFSFPPVINGRRTEVTTDSRELSSNHRDGPVDHRPDVQHRLLRARRPRRPGRKGRRVLR